MAAWLWFSPQGPALLAPLLAVQSRGQRIFAGQYHPLVSHSDNIYVCVYCLHLCCLVFSQLQQPHTEGCLQAIVSWMTAYPGAFTGFCYLGAFTSSSPGSCLGKTVCTYFLGQSWYMSRQSHHSLCSRQDDFLPVPNIELVDVMTAHGGSRYTSILHSVDPPTSSRAPLLSPPTSCCVYVLLGLISLHCLVCSD